MKEVHYVDLDATLAKHTDWKGVEHIGEPVPKMMERVRNWLKDGDEVVIFTARLGEKGAFPHIKRWLREQGLDHLRVTNIKGMEATDFWDDKAVAVKPNTGEILGGASDDESWEDDARKAMK